jgi:tellurite resistance protein TerC
VAVLTYANARKLVVSIIGATIILIGVALLVLPGPGTVVIVLGLALLGTEFLWARLLMKRVKEEGNNAARGLWSLIRGGKKK